MGGPDMGGLEKAMAVIHTTYICVTQNDSRMDYYKGLLTEDFGWYKIAEDAFSITWKRFINSEEESDDHRPDRRTEADT